VRFTHVDSHRTGRLHSTWRNFRSLPCRGAHCTGSRIFGSGRIRIRIQPVCLLGFTKVTRRFLATPTSLVYSNRLFFEYGNIFEEKRARLLPTTGEKLPFLQHNLKRLEWTKDTDSLSKASDCDGLPCTKTNDLCVTLTILN